MKNNLKYIVAVLLITIIGFLSCKKTEYSFGNIKTPSSLTLTSAVAGVDATNPNGNGTGTVTITTLATDALTYNIDFGDGKTQVVPSGVITYKYTTPGVNDYMVTVKAVGTGGSVSVISKKITVYVAFNIPQAILDALTGSGTRTWITDQDAPGHFGVGPADGFSPDWYAATPNSREACAYDDEITFSKDANNTISMAINNKGQSFSIGAASSFYGFSGADACFNILTTGIKKLAFMDATSASIFI